MRKHGQATRGVAMLACGGKMYTTGNVILHGVFACGIVGYGTLAACGALIIMCMRDVGRLP